MIQVYVYPTCSTCKKAQKWLREHEIDCEIIPIHETPPTAVQLETFWHRSQLPLKKFFNTSGQKYRELNLKTTLPTLDEHAQLELLASDGMLIKRPLLISDDAVFVGFNAEAWSMLSK